MSGCQGKAIKMHLRGLGKWMPSDASDAYSLAAPSTRHGSQLQVLSRRAIPRTPRGGGPGRGVQEGFRDPQEETRDMGSGGFELNGAGNELGSGFRATLLGRFAVFRPEFYFCSQDFTSTIFAPMQIHKTMENQEMMKI